MIITRDNYEPFFLDYLEGKLEENMIDAFLDFLEQHPDLKEELHLFEEIELSEEPIVFPGKGHLYKSEAEEKTAFEIKSIALMEGDLKNEEGELFEAYLASHPELKKEYELFTQTRLVTDTGIQYPGKQHLYKKSAAFIWLNWAVAAAAVVVILLGINVLLESEKNRGLPSSEQEIALVKPQPAAPKQLAEPTVKTPEAKTVERTVPKTDPKTQTPDQHIKVNRQATKAATMDTPAVQRDLKVMEEITPLLASLEVEAEQIQLAVSYGVKVKNIQDSRNVMTLDEFLASRAKKAGNEGLLSAHRIIRTGLNVASELSGDRIGYNVKNGKVSSIGIETKLLAFSIPLQKKQ